MNYNTIPCEAECLRPVLCRLVADPSRVDEPLLESVHEYLFAATECRFKTPDKEVRKVLAYLQTVVKTEGIRSASGLRHYFDQLDSESDKLLARLARKSLGEQLIREHFRPVKAKRRVFPHFRRSMSVKASTVRGCNPGVPVEKRPQWLIKSVTRAFTFA